MQNEFEPQLGRLLGPPWSVVLHAFGATWLIVDATLAAAGSWGGVGGGVTKIGYFGLSRKKF